MKKVKFDLSELKVNSFITSLNESESGEIKGGTQLSCNHDCDTRHKGCIVSVHNACITTHTNPPFCGGLPTVHVCKE